MLWLGTFANIEALCDTVAYDDSYSGQTHWLFNVTGGTACIWAYAVTYESAKRILGFLLDINDPLESHPSAFCISRNCPFVWPPPFSIHEPISSSRKASDVNGCATERHSRNYLQGASRDIKH